VSIYAYGQSKPIAHLKDADPLAGRPADPFTAARLADLTYLVPRAQALVVVQPRELNVRMIPVNPAAEMTKSGVEVPWVTSLPPRTFKPGQAVRYPLAVKSKSGGVTFGLDSPAAGATITPDGAFTFIPKADAPAEVRVLIRLKDARGAESVHAFPLTRED
jgi:hypothetical protein